MVKLDGSTKTVDKIGRITVQTPVKSGLTFNLVSEYGYGVTRDWKIVEHRFGDLATMGIQRYSVGGGARRFQFIKSSLNYNDRRYLNDFYDSVQGSFQSFTYPVPNDDISKMPARQWPAGFTNYEVIFDLPPLSATDLANRVQTGISFVEVLDSSTAPSYTVNNVSTRFPPDAILQRLAYQAQTIVPLIHIKVRNPAVPDIYLSDRRLNMSGFPGAPNPTTFLARLLGIGQPGQSDVIMSQSIDGRADTVRFTFGNADRAMTALLNDCSIEYAGIDLSLFHVQSNSLIQLWKGVVISWEFDGSPHMSVQCSDGMFPITQAYPPRAVSRQCWKPFNADVVPGYRPCPYSTASSGAQGGDPNSCDYNYNSKNGCLAHGMSQYFGGHPEQPQSVSIKDMGASSFWNQVGVLATSILSDSIWGAPLPEIWCNSMGSPQRAYWATCMVAAVREESTFMDVLGIVGAGPIGQFEGMSVQTNSDGNKFVVAPTADGLFPQGLKLDSHLNITTNTMMGLRWVLGNDPSHLATSATDGWDSMALGQGTPQYWAVADPTFHNIPTPNQVVPYAAGTAMCEIRYPIDAGKGVTPTTAESHNMQVPVRYGLTANVFDINDTRSLLTGCINPFWIAANSYFRALGIQSADPATQLSVIVRESITNSAGMGSADIAGTWVNPIVGTVLPGYTLTPTGAALYGANLDYYNNTFTYQTGTSTIHSISINQAISQGYVQQIGTSGMEPQFMFQGAVGNEFKPFRDWLTEILNCCLGYFCFEFGKLLLGIRYTAIPTDNFEMGSMIYQSLSVTPISGQFEYLKINFANVELQYQSDFAEYQDKDHALYYGRGGAPLTSSMKSIGISTLSQGLRVAVSRVREEIGGILRPDQPNPYVEWDNNKRATFKTTLLALNTEVGQVVSITHPDIATYPGAPAGAKAGANPPFPANTWPFRIKKWMLHSDWSVTVVADSCVDSMYALEVGHVPTGVGPRPMPILYFGEPLGQWAPHQVQADLYDALYPSEWSFSLTQTFRYGGDGTLLTSAVMGGCLPVNEFIPNCGAPDIKKGGASWAPGGSIPGGTTIYVQVCASIVTSSNTTYSPPSEILVLQVPPDGNNHTITINNIVWPQVSGLTSWAFFAGISEDLICLQAWGPGQPTSIMFNGPVIRQTYSVPDYDLHILRLRATRMIHGGVLGAEVQAIDHSSITSWNTIDVAGTDNWTGRVLAIIGRQMTDGVTQFQHFNVQAWNPATGVYTLDRDPITEGHVNIGDTFVICFKGYDNSATPNVIGDPGLANANNSPPHSAETPHDPTRIGQMVRVIKGTGRGLSAKIIDNDTTSYTLDRNLVIDATSIWVVTDPGWSYSKDVVVDNAEPLKTTLSEIPINNYYQTQLLLEGVTIDNEGDIVDDTNACVRMLYIPGVQGTTNVTTVPPPLGRNTVLAVA